MKPEIKKAYLQLHLAIFLWGFTAILGELISLAGVPLVWHRLWITIVVLFFVPGALKALRQIPKKQIIQFSLIGFVVAAHWVTFYGSIKVSNPSIAVSCLATSSLFTSFIEPILSRKKINPIEVILGLVAMIGIWIMFNAAFNFLAGLIMGLISAFLSALFSSLNKKYATGSEAKAVTIIEMGSGLILLSIIMPFYFKIYPELKFIPLRDDWFWLIILGAVCTAFNFVISLNALKHISAYMANLSLNLEPVYGVILAALIFNDHKDLNSYFYLGTLIILAAVASYPFLLKKWPKYAAS